MVNSLEHVDEVLHHAQPVTDDTPPDTLRQWRAELVQTSVYVSYAVSVLALDEEILAQCQSSEVGNALHSLVESLPSLLATGWVGGGWSLSPDAVASVSSADELTRDYAEGLLGLHGELCRSDLSDAGVVTDLLERVREQRAELSRRRDDLEARVRLVQSAIRAHYRKGTATIDDWLR